MDEDSLELDEEELSPAEEARIKERITLRRNPQLAGDLLEIAFPYAESEQEAIRHAMSEAIKRAKKRCQHGDKP